MLYTPMFKSNRARSKPKWRQRSNKERRFIRNTKNSEPSWWRKKEEKMRKDRRRSSRQEKMSKRSLIQQTSWLKKFQRVLSRSKERSTNSRQAREILLKTLKSSAQLLKVSKLTWPSSPSNNQLSKPKPIDTNSSKCTVQAFVSKKINGIKRE